jgi:hypothetical protein
LFAALGGTALASGSLSSTPSAKRHTLHIYKLAATSGGTVLHESGVAHVSHSTGTGVYDVTMKHSVANCVEVASIGDSSAPTGLIAAYGAPSVSPRTVRVRTFDATGTAADRTFQLIVDC